MKGKRLTIEKDTADKYLVYIMSPAYKMEVEFPANKTNNWRKFKYSYFLRGGGKGNDGMDLNYLQFTTDGYKYLVYEI